MSAANDIKSGQKHPMPNGVPVIERLLCEEAGQDLIEYALIFSFVALGAIAAMKSVTAGVVTVFTAIGTTLTNAV